MSIVSWNVRGLNEKGLEVRQLIRKCEADLVFLLETTVHTVKFDGFFCHFGEEWGVVTNVEKVGEREREPDSIWILWHKDCWEVEVLEAHL